MKKLVYIILKYVFDNLIILLERLKMLNLERVKSLGLFPIYGGKFLLSLEALHVLVICSIIFWPCCVAHPSEVCVYECKEWKQHTNLIISNPPPPAPPSEKLIVSGPYWLEISHLVIPKLIDASHKTNNFHIITEYHWGLALIKRLFWCVPQITLSQICL